MRVLLLTANLGNFDNPVKSIFQELPRNVAEIRGYQFNDSNFPPITGLSGRFQYRIPKLFGLGMLPEDMPKFDVVIWYDSSMGLLRPDSVKWFLEQLGDSDIAFFRHPWRNTVQQEVDHIEDKLKEGNKYITSRYKNGLHKQMLEVMKKDGGYKDDLLLASTAFIYRNSKVVHNMMIEWWFYQSRFYTCDQVALPYVIYRSAVDVKTINEHIFKNKYIGVVSKHK